MSGGGSLSQGSEPADGSTGRRLRVGTLAHVRSFVREPTVVALLVLLPPVAVELYGVAMSSFPSIPGLGGDPGTAGRLAGALFAASFLAGLVGLFQVIGAQSGDERLAVAGFPRASLLATRLVTTGLVAAFGAVLALTVVWNAVAVEAPVVAGGALVLAGGIYGLLGVVIGAAVPRELEGSLVLVFLADVDNALASGLFDTGETVAKLFPLYHPHRLFEAAVLDGSVETGHALWSGAYLLALLVAAFVVYTRAASEGVVG